MKEITIKDFNGNIVYVALVELIGNDCYFDFSIPTPTTLGSISVIEKEMVTELYGLPKQYEFPSVRIRKGSKILSARFIIVDESCRVTEDFSVTKEIQSVIDRSEWKSGGVLRLVLEKEK